MTKEQAVGEIKHISDVTGKNDQITPEQLLVKALQDVKNDPDSLSPNACIILLIRKEECMRHVATYRSNVTWDDELAIYSIKAHEQLTNI